MDAERERLESNRLKEDTNWLATLGGIVGCLWSWGWGGVGFWTTGGGFGLEGAATGVDEVAAAVVGVAEVEAEDKAAFLISASAFWNIGLKLKWKVEIPWLDHQF